MEKTIKGFLIFVRTFAILKFRDLSNKM